MKVLGLDPSMRATGAVALEPQAPRRPMRWLAREFTSDSADPLECGVEQALMLRGVLEDLKPGLVVIEDFAWAARGNRTIDLAIVQTCLRLMLRACGARWVAVAPSANKRWALGKGVGSKKEMVAACRERWAFEPATHNVADAFSLAMLGAASLGDHYEALDGVRSECAARLATAVAELGG